MGVDQDRQQTARTRRASIIRALGEGFDLTDVTSPLSKFKALIEDPVPRLIIGNADIDGVVSAQMLASVTGWQVVALIDRAGQVFHHPSFASPQRIIESGRAFGVDVFSPLFPGASNHPTYFGARMLSPAAVRQALDAFDAKTDRAVKDLGILNLSSWARISASSGSKHPNGMNYKYPLGTAQLLLAALEAAGHSPKIFDRQYLPWMIANCDGGVDTIRTYAWNAEMWWSALAAAVGPASHSESIYRLVTNQRPNEFLDMDRRLRYDEPVRALHLTTKWNIHQPGPESLAIVADLISDLSGWPDPFMGGGQSLSTWTVTMPTRNVLNLTGITQVDPGLLSAHLDAASRALHANLSKFQERGTALGWYLPDVDPSIEATLASVTPVEDIPDEPPSIPDVDES